MKSYWGGSLLAGFGLVISSGCNVYSFADKPSGDSQLLSAARACFDLGDFVCAAKYYGQVSSASSDQANSEASFEVLAQNGAGVAVFMAAFKNISSAGTMITQIASTLSNNANQTVRLNIFHGYQKNTLINDVHLKGLVRFTSSLALIGEILGEAASKPGLFQQKDLVANPTICTSMSSVFYVDPSCYGPAGTALIAGAAPLDLTTATDATMSGSPSLFMINAAIVELDAGLRQMSSSGNLSSQISSFTDAFVTAGTAGISLTGSSSYRGTLLSFGVGTN